VEESDDGLASIVLSCWLPSTPDAMRQAFNLLLDTVEDEAEGIIDWGTLLFEANRIVHPTTGQELHLFTIGVKEMR
jgi:hypothetical protein